MPIATKSSKHNISKESATASIAKKISLNVNKGDVLFFFGEIGVGKTTFIRYLINNIQKKNRLKLTEVTSPTFNLLNEYEVKDFLIEHYDLFRLKNINDTKNIGLLENSKNVLTLVEWPEKIKKKPKSRIELIFKYKSKLDQRILKINDFR
ncbi:MAG: tRNA (adenosine(37)-N6)-threonylcarbamoyltransferase complex ATPase subunit type 1 TsaE [Pelagibacteraceae bacterium TMED268]|nr:MAG: tRNA (adenosine(37)-N6)-threonylcarbamoyltransferase complex ATPase subunit type 1 TsaE [Pelagibacteraceae bacterium TMED268]